MSLGSKLKGVALERLIFWFYNQLVLCLQYSFRLRLFSLFESKTFRRYAKQPVGPSQTGSNRMDTLNILYPPNIFCLSRVSIASGVTYSLAKIIFLIKLGIRVSCIRSQLVTRKALSNALALSLIPISPIFTFFSFD